MFRNLGMLGILTICASVPLNAYGAQVKCGFMSETQITKDGVWQKTETDIMKLYSIFGDGLVLPLENALLAKLDSKLPFLAGETDRGKVYLMGGPIGVMGKNILVDGDVITLYEGLCTVSFG